VLHLIAKVIPVTSLVRDGHVGHHHAWRTAQQGHGHRLSTRRSDSAWSMPDEGPDAGTGPPRQDGRQLDDRRMPEPSLNATTVEHHLQTCVYQAPLRHQAFAPARNVVILVKTHRHTPATAPVIRFSRDLELPDDTRRDDDSRRFQLACNVRDAKPSWGLEDVMPMTPTGVTHAAHLSWCMVKGASRLQTDGRQHDPDDRSLD
jgi:hypothetical protein